MSQRWNARRKKTLYNCICPYFFSNLNDQNYWMDAGEMIHGSVDTLPHKGHKRMFLINARRSLLVQGGAHKPRTPVHGSRIRKQNQTPPAHLPWTVIILA